MTELILALATLVIAATAMKLHSKVITLTRKVDELYAEKQRKDEAEKEMVQQLLTESELIRQNK